MTEKRLYLIHLHTELGPPGFYRVFWEEIKPMLDPHGHQHVINVMKHLGSLTLLTDFEAKSEGRCWYCGCEVISSTELSNPNNREIDHRLPRARRGSDLVKNLVVSCRRCNNTAHPGKGTRSAPEYRDWLAATFYPGRKLVFWGDVCGHIIKLQRGEREPKQFHGFLCFLTQSEAALHVFSRAQVAALLQRDPHNQS